MTLGVASRCDGLDLRAGDVPLLELPSNGDRARPSGMQAGLCTRVCPLMSRLCALLVDADPESQTSCFAASGNSG